MFLPTAFTRAATDKTTILQCYLPAMTQEIESKEKIEPPNKTVPWTGWEVLLFFGIWFTVQIVCGAVIGVAAHLLPSEQSQVIEVEGNHGHPIAQLVEQSKNSPLAFLIIFPVVFLAGIVVAPLIEEFLFRMLLQGWLEATLARYEMPWASGIAIVLVSLLFAAIHAGNTEALGTLVLLLLFVLASVANLSIFVLGLVYLAWGRNIRIDNYLFGTKPFFRSCFFINVKRCLYALVILYGISGSLWLLYPQTNTDPIPIFFFSLLLGTIYSRTQNLSYCVLLHACLNMISLTIAWLMVLFTG